MAEKKGDSLLERARARAEEIANTDVEGSLKVTFEDRLAVFSGKGYNEWKPNVLLNFGDGTRRRVSTVKGEMERVVHEYPGSGPFTAWTQYDDTEDRIATCSVKPPKPAGAKDEED